MKYRVKIGYGQNDYVQIDETDLEKAVKAQVTGKVALFAGGSVSGNSIMAILPDYNYALGFKPDYQLNGEDYAELGSKVIESHRLALENANNKVALQLESGNNLRLN